MLEVQHGLCAICRSASPQGRGRWHIDHDHVSGQFRGLLCNNCNRGIGYFGDDPDIIRAAADYVAEPQPTVRLRSLQRVTSRARRAIPLRRLPGT
jgi:hypothetical protein